MSESNPCSRLIERAETNQVFWIMQQNVTVSAVFVILNSHRPMFRDISIVRLCTSSHDTTDVVITSIFFIKVILRWGKKHTWPVETKALSARTPARIQHFKFHWTGINMFELMFSWLTDSLSSYRQLRMKGALPQPKCRVRWTYIIKWCHPIAQVQIHYRQSL